MPFSPYIRCAAALVGIVCVLLLSSRVEAWARRGGRGRRRV